MNSHRTRRARDWFRDTISSMTIFDTDVLVVGAGPVGLVLAVDLARRGTRVRVIDRRTEPTDESRAVVVHSRSLEMMDALGAVDDIVASGRTTVGVHFHADGKLLAQIPLDTVDSAYPFTVTTAQTETEAVLTRRLLDLGVEIQRGAELTGFVQDDDGVRATVGDATVACRYLVGCDGASSTVRHHLGLKLQGSFVGERFLMGDVDATYPFDTSAMHIFASAGSGPAMLFPMVGDRVRVIAAIDASESRRAPSLDWLQRLCTQRGLGVHLRSPRWLTTFEIHHAQVPRYRTGRVFLAGDAAHVHSPAGGQGMNTGMQDAFNLGWKLAAATRGNASELLLDSYHDERHPVAAHVIAETTTLTTAATVESKVVRTVRNKVLRIVAGTKFAQHRIADEMEEFTVAYHGSPIVRQGVHGHVAPGDAAPSVAGTELWHSLARAHREHPNDHLLVAGTPSMSVPGTTPVVVDDPERKIAQRYGLKTPDGVVLVRPDGYVGAISPLGDRAPIDAALALL
ncbi:hypothetical protein CH267_21900 [Rhodococcus sp. 06-621-2]|nr:hypothetical protein CH267_21900 [Rhodococcus sp. 06-621-2]